MELPKPPYYRFDHTSVCLGTQQNNQTCPDFANARIKSTVQSFIVKSTSHLLKIGMMNFFSRGPSSAHASLPVLDRQAV